MILQTINKELTGRAQTLLDNDTAESDTIISDKMVAGSKAETEALAAALEANASSSGSGTAIDESTGMTGLQEQLACARPGSPGYAQLQKAVYEQEVGTAFSMSGDAIYKLIGASLTLTSTPKDPSLYHVPEGPLEKLEGVAIAGALSRNNNMFERFIYGSLATTFAPFSAAEWGGRQLLETPNHFYLAGWNGAAAWNTSGTERWNYASTAAGNFLQGSMNILAITGIGAAYDGVTDTFSIGSGILRSSRMTTTAIGAGTGTIAGYKTGGWNGALVGGVVGGAVSLAVPEGSPEFSDSFGVMFGTTAKHVAINGAGGGIATVAANVATGQNWKKDWGYGVAFGVAAPLVSGESFFIGAGGVEEFGPAAANTFSSATGAANIASAAMIAAKNKHEGQP